MPARKLNMANNKSSIEDYLAGLPEDRREPMTSLRQVIAENLPEGFEEVMQEMPSYVVPLSTFPDSYHCTPDTPFRSFLRSIFLAIWHKLTPLICNLFFAVRYFKNDPRHASIPRKLLT